MDAGMAEAGKSRQKREGDPLGLGCSTVLENLPSMCEALCPQHKEESVFFGLGDMEEPLKAQAQKAEAIG